MTHFTYRLAMFAFACIALASAAVATPVRYDLDTKASTVGFRFMLNGIAQDGSMPVQKADIVIDPQNLAASTVDVILNVTRARTGLIFATQALTGPDVLDAKQFPTIRFVSDSVRLAKDGRLSDGARIHGKLTMHGVTRPIVLNANLYRARGSAADDLGMLTVRLGGSVSRTAFGASGYPDLVDDLVTLDITAVIRAIR